MCGIYGMSNLRKKIEHKDFEQQLSTLAHRGPDGQKTVFLENNKVALGHTRLSIIDLSPNGSQPMTNENETIWITFNGEIYNFKELKKELISLGHHFKSESDTEVIIHGYEEWGSKVLDKLNGMFAFGLYDSNKKQWFLARDRFGIKPLFFFQNKEKFVFASELKAIIADEEIPRNIDFDALADFFIYRFIPSSKCIWKSITKLPPGHLLILNEDFTFQISRYWELKPADTEISEKRLIEKADFLLSESVKKRMLSDVPIGLFLSGGYDSSIIAHYLNQFQYPIRSYSMGFKNWEKSEAKYAQLVADLFHSNHKALIFDKEDIGNLVKELSFFYDEPLGGSSFVPTYLLSKMASKDVKVVLGGDGGDEVFAGYNWHKDIYQAWHYSFIQRCKRKIIGNQQFIKKRYHQSLNWTGWRYRDLGGIFSSSLLNDQLEKDDYWIYKKAINEQYGPIKAMQLLDYDLFLPEVILQKVDRASMANGLEVRVPFLDHELSEFMIGLHQNSFYTHGTNKYVLNKIMQSVFPSSILNKPKKGFGMPISKYIKNLDLIRFIEKSKLKQSGILNKNYEKNIERSASFNKLWALFIFANWYERWG